MRYCARCTYPENAKPTILFDDEGVCSGCRVTEAKKQINWDEREVLLKELLEEYKAKAREAGQVYDCIIPVSGGKDSHIQVHTIKNVYGLNPLLVTYNHVFNTPLGVRNLRNLVKQYECDIIRFTSRADAVRRIDKYMLKRVGDITWHYHTGIFTFPFQVAVEKKIPLVIWGDHGLSELTGMFRLEDMPEFTTWVRKQYDMRGVEIEEIIEDTSNDITRQDVAPFIFPETDLMEEIGVRGIYLGNYIEWNHLKQIKFLTKEHDFKMASWKRDRTFSLFHKVDDHANDVHDYLKYLKFGYGRGTDHTAEEIRAGRMSREQAKKVIAEYDHVRPKSLDLYLEYLDMTEEEFDACVEDQRDPSIWEKVGGVWKTKHSIMTSDNLPEDVLEKARLPLLPEEDQTFGYNNRHFYYSENFEAMPAANDRFISEGDGKEFLML